MIVDSVDLPIVPPFSLKSVPNGRSRGWFLNAVAMIRSMIVRLQRLKDLDCKAEDGRGGLALNIIGRLARIETRSAISFTYAHPPLCRFHSFSQGPEVASLF